MAHQADDLTLNLDIGRRIDSIDPIDEGGESFIKIIDVAVIDRLIVADTVPHFADYFSNSGNQRDNFSLKRDEAVGATFCVVDFLLGHQRAANNHAGEGQHVVAQRIEKLDRIFVIEDR